MDFDGHKKVVSFLYYEVANMYTAHLIVSGYHNLWKLRTLWASLTYCKNHVKLRNIIGNKETLY